MGPTVITGLSGTVGPALRAALESSGRRCAGWDRATASPDDPAAVRARLDALDPAAVCHLALGAEAWAGALAAWCARRGRPFLLTSSVMVFEGIPGPHRIGDPPRTTDGYGSYKARVEAIVRAAHPAAIVARLGWQIGAARGGNHMLEQLSARAERGETLRASTRWIPATSFLEDTADALRRLLDAGAGGLYHVDGNAESAWDFHRLVLALRARHGAAWRVEPCEDHTDDQRLLDDRLRVGQVAARLG
jgi:dTDP-4-dehydrorhamnose reductase